jgi:hypothetical protein
MFGSGSGRLERWTVGASLAAAASFILSVTLGALGDGGLVASTKREFIDRTRLLRTYGWTRPVNRPHCIVEDCALVPLAAKDRSVSMTYCRLMSVVNGGWADASAERAHIEAGMRVQALEKSYQVNVPGQSLSVLLDRHGLGHVDLLSLDVEGFEPQALEGLDF